jgi:hypothetical protein
MDMAVAPTAAAFKKPRRFQWVFMDEALLG